MLQLKQSDSNPATRKRNKKATPEEIQRYATIGKSHIFYEGESFFLDPTEEFERVAFQKKVDLMDYKWFQEETGNMNWVLYNPIQYKPDVSKSGKKILRYFKESYRGGRFEMPVNASSCCGMFSWVTLPENFELGKLFKTNDIVDMNLMFAGCVMPKGFSLGEYFDTSSVKDMQYMFYECDLPGGFSFGQHFDTSGVENMGYMFAKSKLPRGLDFPESFATDKVKDMNHMFYKATFPASMKFGNRFTVSENTNKVFLFTNCTVAEKNIGSKNSESIEYLKELLQE